MRALRVIQQLFAVQIWFRNSFSRALCNIRRCLSQCWLYSFKALLHVAKVIEEAKALAAHGIVFGEPKTDIDKVRLWKEKVIGQLTTGLAGMAKGRKVKVVNGLGKFTGANTLVVEGEKEVTTINFDNAIIAAGSRPIQLPFIPHDDPRVWDSTDALQLKKFPNVC